MNTLLSVAAGCITLSVATVAFAAEPAKMTDADIAEVVRAVCQAYKGQQHTRCLGRAAVVAKEYPQIIRNLEEARRQSPATASSTPSSVGTGSVRQMTVEERRAQRIAERMKQRETAPAPVRDSR